MSAARTIVLDASVAVSWIAREQATPATDALLERLDGLDLHAPQIFGWEIANQCLLRSRRTGVDAGRLIEAIEALSIVYEAGGSAQDAVALVPTAARYALSLFDAAYLDLALALDAPLATRDAALISAATEAGASVLDLR